MCLPAASQLQVEAVVKSTRIHWLQKSWDFLKQRIPSKLQDENGKKAKSLPPAFVLEKQSRVEICREKRNSFKISRKG